MASPFWAFARKNSMVWRFSVFFSFVKYVTDISMGLIKSAAQQRITIPPFNLGIRPEIVTMPSAVKSERTGIKNSNMRLLAGYTLNVAAINKKTIGKRRIPAVRGFRL